MAERPSFAQQEILAPFELTKGQLTYFRRRKALGAAQISIENFRSSPLPIR